MADHEQSDYEFANAEEWETAPPKREKTKARKPPPRPQLNQELHEQLITIASEASTVGKWPAQAPHSGHVEHLPAPSGPQDYNRNRGSANAEEASIKYGAFALPPLDMFEPQQDALMDTGPGPSPYGGTPGDVSGVFSPSPSEYGDDTDTTSTQSEEYSEEESEQDISETDDPDQQFPARNGPAVSGFNFLNLADIRERQGSEPDAIFSLDTRQHYDFERRFFGPRNNNLTHIAKRTSTHLSMPRNPSDPVIEMWGTPEQIKAAKHLLTELVHLINEDIARAEPRVGGWAKVRAGVSERRQRHLEEQAKEARIRRAFRRAPPDGTHFPAVGIFFWPNGEINPQYTLGMSFEHLDSIRFEHRVYIIWNRKRQYFKVLGENQENVENAIERLHGCFCEAAAKSRRPNRMILVKPPSPFKDMKGFRIRIIADHDLRDRQVIYNTTSNSGIQLSLVKSGPSKQFIPPWKQHSIVIRNANDAYMRRVAQQGLHDVTYYRGYVKLKFYIGKLVLFGYKRSLDGHYQLLEYIKEARNPQSAGELIRYLGNSMSGITDEEVALTAILHMKESPNVFTPVDVNESDATTEPQISATFEIKMWDRTEKTAKFRLEVTFVREPSTGNWTVCEHHWLMSPSSGHGNSNPTAKNRKGPIDITVQDLECGFAYQMELSTWDVLPVDTDAYPIFDEFIRYCNVEEIPDAHHNSDAILAHAGPRRIQRVVYANLPGMIVTQLTQKTKYRFWHTGCSYRYEITKYEFLPADDLLGIYPDSVTVSFKGVSKPPDVRWGAAMDNESWENDLRQQINIPRGMRGTWATDVDKFFKPTYCPTISEGYPEWADGNGFEECIGRANDFMLFLKKMQDKVADEKASRRSRGRTNEEDDGASTYGGPEEYDM